MAPGDGGAAGDDPFANHSFDESWAAAAPVREGSAAERDWAVKRARWEAQDRRAAEQDKVWAAARRREQARRRWRRVWPWVALVVAGVMLFGLQRVTGWSPGGPRSLGGFGVPVVDRSGMPTSGIGEQPERVLPQVAAGSGRGYVVAQSRADRSPVTFSPCRVWPVVVNVDGAPAGGYQVVVDAVREVSRRTGIAFVVEGTTGERVADDRAAFQPDLYGDRWAPILVAWTRGGLEAGFAGHGGPTAITLPDTGNTHYVTGQVTLDADGTFNRDRAALRAVLLHEFGHVVGLKHAPSETELMAAANVGQTRYGPGDKAGLALLGAGQCTNEI